MTLLIGALSLLATAALAEPVVSRHVATFTQPPSHVPTNAMPDGPLLGNGDVGVVLGGPPEAQRFYLGKNDFWTRHPADARVITVGHVALNIPALAGANYRQEQDLARAEVRGTFTRDGLTVRTRSWVQADANLLLTELRCEGGTVSVSVRLAAGGHEAAPASVADNGQPAAIGRELHGGGRWYFDGEMADLTITDKVLPAQAPAQPGAAERFDGKTTFREIAVPAMSKTVSVAAWIKIAGVSPDANYIVSKGEWNQAYSLGLSDGRLRWAVNGTYVQTKQPLELGKWIYVAGTFDGHRLCAYVDGQLLASVGGDDETDSRGFTHKADDLPGHGREVAVVTRAVGADGLEFQLQPGVPVTLATALLSDLDAPDFAAAASRLVNDLTAPRLSDLQARHRAWWSAFWARSFLEIPDKEIEKRWYAALYTLGSCSRAGKVAPGLWGNWLTTESPNWHGDFHLNYNFQAPYYIAYASNHADLTQPFYQALIESVPNGRAMARRHGWKGIHFPVCIGPWGLSPEDPDGDFGQRSDAAYASLNFLWYWQYTQDTGWLKTTGYPFLREVADFWEDYLKLENGRYVIYSDSIHEGSGPDVNPILTLGLLRTLFKNLLAMSAELHVDADRRGKWQDILARLSDYPLQERNGKTVFRYSEKGMDWNDSNTLGIMHIFPAGAVGLDSDPKLLAISRDMVEEMHRWSDYNGFSSWYTACARIGYDPATILAKLRVECDEHSFPNLLLYYGGGGIESCGGFLALNEMLLQSHEGVLRLFPCWPAGQDARFGGLRAVGAFLVSAEYKAGQIGGVTIVSERGRDCTVQNPWPGRAVRLSRRGAAAETLSGARFTFTTAAGEVLGLAPTKP